ncbi:tetratricopeptide repeat protein (macronuclear) [Tetrahymena thermophila SB210]|uniref:Tetratricopeptide repeat protein n=1 Tax=Tetrahymena thermophila (strain SB210) TaxID=312017 RepID=Q240W2_TETTS|nr:tetratricopeptide repeat protein [Tetrahymena thermophila SB210]EAS02302.1 tetratricopeptide repeat protein [Tetrahymena thermophila SB210]|eukprot:XP_001022547.1 tetratricopeptide repeat protein [Tetrahymena thermophila SB210]
MLDNIAELLIQEGFQANIDLNSINCQFTKPYLINQITFDGVQLSDGQQVKIQITICDEQLFEKKKRIYFVNQTINNFEFCIKILKQILIDQEKICIFIFENYEETLEEELCEMKKQNINFSEKQIVQMYMNMIYSLIEMCSLNIVHGEINPSNIFRKSNGKYKLLNGQNLSFQEFQELYSEENLYNIFVAPEVKQKLSLMQTNEFQKSHAKWQQDVYSMGLCFLNILQVEINEKVIQYIKNSEFSAIRQNIDPLYKSFCTFIFDFMLQYDGYKRDLPYRLRRSLIYFYSDLHISVEEEYQRIENHINHYNSSVKVDDLYLASQYLVLSQTYLENRCEDHILKCMDILNKLNKNNTFEEALAYLELGIIKVNTQKYSDSLEAYQKSLEIQKRILGDSHILVSYTHNKLAFVYFFLQNQEMSFIEDEISLNFRQINFQNNHTDIADSLSCVGFSYLQKNDLQKALEYSQKSFEMRKELFAENHPDIAGSLEEIGIVFTHMKDHITAHTYYERALQIRQQIYSSFHNEIAKSYDSLAVSFSKLGQEETSLEFDLKALNIRQQIYPKLHPKVARSINNISISYLKLSDYTKALEYAQESYGIRKQILPYYFPDIAESLSTLGSIYYRLENYEEAIKCYQQTIKIFSQIYQILHEYTVDSYLSLSQCYKKQGDIKSALAYELKLLKLREKLYTRYHPDVALSCDNVAMLYSYLHEYHLEQKYYLDSFTIRKRLLDTQDELKNEEYLNSIKNIALSYLNQGKFEKSRQYFSIVFESILHQTSCSQHFISFLNSLTNLHYQMKNYSQIYTQSKTCVKLARQCSPQSGINTNLIVMNHAIISRKQQSSSSQLIQFNS